MTETPKCPYCGAEVDSNGQKRKIRKRMALLAPEAFAGADGGREMGGMNDARRTTYDLY